MLVFLHILGLEFWVYGLRLGLGLGYDFGFFKVYVFRFRIFCLISIV